MSTQEILDEHSNLTCEIQRNEDGSKFVGTLKYNGYENCTIDGPSVEAVRGQYLTICALIDEQGAMLREGTIMLGYHNDEWRGDVLLPDGEVIGSWVSDDEEWCHFTKEGDDEPCVSAPSPWMLQDAIASWLNGEGEEND